MARQVSLGRVVGSTIRNGNVLPTSYAGWLEGDIFVLNDTENNVISYYVYSNGKLTKKGNLSGEKGDIGLQGIPGVGVYSYSGTMQLFYSGNIDISKVALPQGRKLQVGDIVISNAIETTGVYAMITRIESETTAVHARAYGTLKGDNGTSIFATTAALPDSGTTAINTINIIKPDSKDVQTGDLIVSDNEETPGHYGMVETLYVQGAYMYASIKYIGHIIGEKGAPGEAGRAGTITIGEVNTGLPGTDVIVTNTGTDGDAILNFTIPAGKESVIDLGTISSSFQSSVCEDLDGITEIGMYTFKYGNTRYMMNVEKVQTGATTYSTFQYIYTKPDVYFTRINNGTSWNYFGAKYLVDSTDSVTSGNTSNKIFLVGRTSQSITGGTAFSHDTVYVDTDGHLYDSGKRVLTTADNVSGGTVSGDYLPHHTVTLTNNTTPMSTVLSAYGSGLYAITFNGPASGTYIFNVQHQGDTRYGMSAIDINTNATSYYVSKDMSTVTAADFKNSFTSFLKKTGGIITGDLSVAGNLKLNNTRKIVHGNDLYEYTFPKKSGTVALLSDVETNGSGITLIPVTEHISGDTYIYNSDFNFNNLTQENWKNYALQMSHYNGQPLEILKPDKYDSSINGENFYFENSNIGLKVTTSSIYTTTITSYKTPARIILQESYSGSTYKYTSDFDWTKLTPDMFNKYYIEFVGYEGVYREILKANRFIKSDASSQYWYENDNVGIKITPSASERFIVEKYEPEASITSKSASKLVANNHITQSGLSAKYPTINKSGVYLININWGGYSETQVVMWLVIDNPDILFSSPFQINFKDQTYNRLSWANNSLLLVDQSSNPVNITNITITAKLIREY